MELTVSMGTPLDRNTVVAACGGFDACDMLGNTATLGDGTDSGKTRVVVGYRENPAVFA